MFLKESIQPSFLDSWLFQHIGLDLFLSYVSTEKLVCKYEKKFDGNVLMGNNASCKSKSKCMLGLLEP